MRNCRATLRFYCDRLTMQLLSRLRLYLRTSSKTVYANHVHRLTRFYGFKINRTRSIDFSMNIRAAYDRTIIRTLCTHTHLLKNPSTNSDFSPIRFTRAGLLPVSFEQPVNTGLNSVNTGGRFTEIHDLRIRWIRPEAYLAFIISPTTNVPY